MHRRPTYPRCQTLRLSIKLDDLLTEFAYNKSVTKASYLRAALIRQMKMDDEQFNHGPQRSNLQEPVMW